MDVNYDRLPEDVIHRAKMCMIDWIGSAYSGIGSATQMIIYNLIREMGGAKTATLIGSEQGASPMQAALYNGMISAVMEVDDVHEEIQLHPSIGIIPAALATAEYAGSSGKDLITSIVIGYDLSVRLGRCAGMSHYRFWHTTGTCNTFGAAAAAGKLLHLGEQRMTMALGLAGTQAAGLWESINAEATTAKHLHSGKAASNGILSALLARDGFKGSERIVEGERGFLASFSKASGEDILRLTEGFGQPFLIMKNFIKSYACCRGCFEGIEAVDHIMTDHHLNPQDIEEIIVTTIPNRVWTVGNREPKDIFEAKFSAPFCIALMAINKSVGLYQFTRENMDNPVIQDFMRKVKLVSDPNMAPRAQRIEIICKNGALFSQEFVCQSPDIERVKQKFIENMAPLLRKERIQNILSSVENLDKIEQIRELTDILKHTPERRL